MEINWLLVGVLLIIASCAYHGYRSGLVRILFSIATFIITIVIVKLLAPVGVQMIKSDKEIYDSFKAPIEKLLEEKVDGEIRTEEVLDSYQIAPSMKEDILSAAESFGISSIDLYTPTVQHVIADCITLKAIDLLVYVLLFLLINVGLRAIGLLLNRFSKLPGIHGVNQLAGSIFGILEGIAFVWVFFIFVTLFSTTEWGSWCFQRIGDSTLLSILYAQNIFLVFV